MPKGQHHPLYAEKFSFDWLRVFWMSYTLKTIRGRSITYILFWSLDTLPMTCVRSKVVDDGMIPSWKFLKQWLDFYCSCLACRNERLARNRWLAVEFFPVLRADLAWQLLDLLKWLLSLYWHSMLWTRTHCVSGGVPAPNSVAEFLKINAAVTLVEYSQFLVWLYSRFTWLVSFCYNYKQLLTWSRTLSKLS